MNSNHRAAARPAKADRRCVSAPRPFGADVAVRPAQAGRRCVSAPHPFGAAAGGPAQAGRRCVAPRPFGAAADGLPATPAAGAARAGGCSARRSGGRKKVACLACKGLRLVVVLRSVKVGFHVGGLHRLPVRRCARGRRVSVEAGSSRRDVRRVVSFSNTARLSWKPESVSRPAMATGSLSGGPSTASSAGREAT